MNVTGINYLVAWVAIAGSPGHKLYIVDDEADSDHRA